MARHPDARIVTALPDGIVLRHAEDDGELSACYPVIAQLRPALGRAETWLREVAAMAPDGYRVLAAWRGEQVLAVTGYRTARNLIHGRFLYVDDLVTAEAERGRGLGAALLQELAAIATGLDCARLVLDTAANNVGARRFYAREGLFDVVAGFVMPLGPTR